MDLQAVRKTVSKIKSNLFKKSNSHSIGILKSQFRGIGLQFKEHQVYNLGDEVRFIDWKILAKTGTPFIKTFEEERNVEIVMVIDAGATMLYGHNGISKLQAAIELCCLYYLLAEDTHDLIHTIILSNEIINLPKKSGEQGISILIAALQEKGIMNSNGKIRTDLIFKDSLSNEVKTANLMKYLKRNKEIIFVSDYIDFLDKSILQRMAYRRNVHGYRILAPLDKSTRLPFVVNFDDGSGKNIYGKLDTIQDKVVDDIFGKKFKKIEVDKSYLDIIAKELA